MGSLSRIAPNFLSAVNENTLALATVKFDFSLIKVEAPIEFNPLGTALSVFRRHEAEDGGHHQTARRLGALFEQIVPSTPKLISAYGTRVSEIIKLPGVNPTGMHKHGPFRDYVGADATAIWAAATSGISAIAMYMLACFIAQIFPDHKEAVAIWAELVSERRNEICRQGAANYNIPESTMYSTRQEIARKDLAEWDNSARSWLRSADKAMSSKKRQLQLIVENLLIPHRSGRNTYEKLIRSCFEAMEGLEYLLNGMPQEAQTKSMPLALLAWHLFPDLLVLSKTTKHVPLSDPLFPSGAKLTLGAVTVIEQEPGDKTWSLALSHYQYYGRAVQIRSEEDMSRVTIEESVVIGLGAMMGVWGIEIVDVHEMVEAAQWLMAAFASTDGKRLKLIGQMRTNWLDPLLDAAEVILGTSKESDLDVLLRVLRFGGRRCHGFFANDTKPLLPCFGLRNPLVLSSLRDSSTIDEAEIKCCRSYAEYCGLTEIDCIIVYRPDQDDKVYFISTGPVPCGSKGKRNSDGEEKIESTLCRWYGWTEKEGGILASDPSSLTIGIQIESSSQDDEFTRERISIPNEPDDTIKVQNGETIIPGIYGKWEEAGKYLEWYSAPGMFLSGHKFSPLKCTKLHPKCEIPAKFQLFHGTNRIGLFINLEREHLFPEKVHKTPVTEQKRKLVSFEASIQSLKNTPRACLDSYIQQFAPEEILDETTQSSYGHSHSEYQIQFPRLRPIGSGFEPSPDCVRSLKSLMFARSVFREMHEATVSMKAFGGPKLLCKTHWSKVCNDGMSWPTSELWQSRPLVLACVLYMDSGTIDMSAAALQYAVAVSRENNIFVISGLLDDPFTSLLAKDIRIQRLVGNVSRSGTSILTAPMHPLVREPGDNMRIVNHNPYDFKPQDRFEGTSLHLQFTEWSLPIAFDNTSHAIDHDAQYLEAVIKVRDRGNWVADLDILPAVDDMPRCWLSISSPFTVMCEGADGHLQWGRTTAIDSWEELLDPPIGGICVFRSRGNWAARLAAVSILVQKDLWKQVIVTEESGDNCLICQSADVLRHIDTRPVYIID